MSCQVFCHTAGLLPAGPALPLPDPWPGVAAGFPLPSSDAGPLATALIPCTAKQQAATPEHLRWLSSSIQHWGTFPGFGIVTFARPHLPPSDRPGCAPAPAHPPVPHLARESAALEGKALLAASVVPAQGQPAEWAQPECHGRVCMRRERRMPGTSRAQLQPIREMMRSPPATCRLAQKKSIADDYDDEVPGANKVQRTRVGEMLTELTIQKVCRGATGCTWVLQLCRAWC